MTFKGYIYETTNLIDGTKYIGKRETLKDIDTYLGSGKHLKRAIKKYGRESFKKRVLCFYDSKKELGDAEKYFISVYRHFYGRDGMYNIADGGEGGGHVQTEDTRSKISASHKGKQLSEEQKAKISKANKGENAYWYGKQLSEETKKKLSDAHKGEKCYWYGRTGENNPMYGKPAANRRKVNQYDLNGNFIRTWNCISEAAKELGINRGNLTMCCNGKRNKAGGFVFKYK